MEEICQNNLNLTVMATTVFTLKIILENNYNERNFKVYFSTPDNRVNCETGLLLLIAGFDANSQSNIYKK
ncbi:hypothetical protein [Clostridium beijerinckii]|jgi:hypothetical protein|uniref:hypothetical protein n=2 Tax=Clostridium beijerinckii TaxID=1520 RepID=UPI0011158F3C|nr:hypothetical protein [Clostridium beijerinckii]NRT64931.1 hypothetical protein [Clostridium beijerinckii]NRU49883.1 hypothetical protein [Clostridium beijerinckii]NRZ32118.1 hypothetical protein [Clostridium beijerinckii]NSA11333.1 hypothetical protein [Clostridium beijerinckii]NSA61148.1 hypothetical protein [Clostridium beijerinckii]